MFCFVLCGWFFGPAISDRGYRPQLHAASYITHLGGVAREAFPDRYPAVANTKQVQFARHVRLGQIYKIYITRTAVDSKIILN